MGGYGFGFGYVKGISLGHYPSFLEEKFEVFNNIGVSVSSMAASSVLPWNGESRWTFLEYL